MKVEFFMTIIGSDRTGLIVMADFCMLESHVCCNQKTTCEQLQMIADYNILGG